MCVCQVATLLNTLANHTNIKFDVKFGLLMAAVEGIKVKVEDLITLVTEQVSSLHCAWAWFMTH